MLWPCANFSSTSCLRYFTRRSRYTLSGNYYYVHLTILCQIFHWISESFDVLVVLDEKSANHKSNFDSSSFLVIEIFHTQTKKNPPHGGTRLKVRVRSNVINNHTLGTIKVCIRLVDWPANIAMPRAPVLALLVESNPKNISLLYKHLSSVNNYQSSLF